MNRNFRLTQSTDFKRVRRSGRSYAHPLIVLVVLASEGERTLIGVTAAQSMNSAVQRNRAKRLVREAVRPLLPRILPGWKLVIIARSGVLKAEFIEIQNSLLQLLLKAGLIDNRNG